MAYYEWKKPDEEIPFHLLNLVSSKVTRDMDKPETATSFHHLDPLFCPQGSTAFYLYLRFFISNGWDFHDNPNLQQPWMVVLICAHTKAPLGLKLVVDGVNMSFDRVDGSTPHHTRLRGWKMVNGTVSIRQSGGVNDIVGLHVVGKEERKDMDEIGR